MCEEVEVKGGMIDFMVLIFDGRTDIALIGDSSVANDGTGSCQDFPFLKDWTLKPLFISTSSLDQGSHLVGTALSINSHILL